MDRQEKCLLAAALLVLPLIWFISVRGGMKQASAGASASLKAGLADVTSGQAVHASSPWDRSSDMAYEHNSWTSPPWEMAKVGVVPLRRNHPLYRRPYYTGHNRHKVMCDGWNGWFYDPPSEDVL